MSTKTIRYTIDLSSKEHKRISTAASLLGLTMKDFFLLSIEEFTHKKFNKITKKALKDVNLKKELRKFDSLQEMFDDLGI